MRSTAVRRGHLKFIFERSGNARQIPCFYFINFKIDIGSGTLYSNENRHRNVTVPKGSNKTCSSSQ